MLVENRGIFVSNLENDGNIILMNFPCFLDSCFIDL